MDSKTKRLTLLGVLSVILLIGVVVVFMNYDKLMLSSKTTATVEKENVTEQNSQIAEEGIANEADLSAFLQDDTFFDYDEKQWAGTKDVEGNRETDTTSDKAGLSLLATSVQKDLRIKVVDYDGKAIAGYGFVIDIAEVGTYQDEDKDGIIYVPDLKPGEYEITVQEMEGFQVPAEPLTARVKAVVAYMAIEDISYLIHSEAEIDASVEDAVKQVDEEDEDDTQYTALMDEDNLDDAVKLGIDVSKWNGEIDWDVVAAEGIEFAIIRCGYRGLQSGMLVEDPFFKENLEGAKKAGIKVGVYFYSQATNPIEAVEEASMAIELLDGAQLDYPLFIDTEGGGGNSRADQIDVNTRTLVCQYFCKTVKNEGYTPGVYSGRNFYNTKLNVADLEEYTIWLAEYRETPLYDKRYDMWQYTSKGAVAGIDGNVDLNVSYLGY